MYGLTSEIPAGAQTLARGLSVIQAVADGAEDLKSVAERTELGRSTAHRLIQLLLSQGYLRLGTRGYSLGPALIDLGFKALHGNPLPVVARPVLEELSAQVSDTVHLAVEDDGSVLYLDKLPGSRGAEMRSANWISHAADAGRGGKGPAARCARTVGRGVRGGFGAPAVVSGAKDAGFEEFNARMQDYARLGASMDLEDNEPGIRCVAVPVRDASRAIVGAISVSATRPYMPAARMRGLVPVVTRAAGRISAALGYREP